MQLSSATSGCLARFDVHILVTRLGSRSDYFLAGQDIVLRVPAESEDVLQQDMRQLLKAVLQIALVRGLVASLVILLLVCAV